MQSVTLAAIQRHPVFFSLLVRTESRESVPLWCAPKPTVSRGQPRVGSLVWTAGQEYESVVPSQQRSNRLLAVFPVSEEGLQRALDAI